MERLLSPTIGAFVDVRESYSESDLSGQIVEGNWVVKRAAGTTPAILGTKLKQHHFRGDKYLETDLEIGAWARRTYCCLECSSTSVLKRMSLMEYSPK